MKKDDAFQKIEELSIFFPFWNEEKNIEAVVSSAIPVAEKVAKKWEIIMIDDGSSDKTLEIAKLLEKQQKNLSVISHIGNRGYGSAIKEGLTHAKYAYIVFNDGDRQFDFSEVTRFLEKIYHADIVIGFRKKRVDHPFRHMLMNLLKIWDLFFFGFYYKDIDCGFKMFKKEAVQAILPLYSEGAMITTEIFARAKKKHLIIAEVEVTHYPRKYGDQSGGNPRVVLRAIFESLLLWIDLNLRK